MTTEPASQVQQRSALTSLDYVGIVLVVLTGVIHIYEGIEDLDEGIIGILFLLAGLGFFGALVLLYLGVNQPLLYGVGIIYTGIQFVAYFILRWPSIYDPLGLFDKAIQAVLILVLAILYVRKRP
ncbi:hypothetical protein BG842_21745 [Haladaptatus sp. W1]|uniref:DUF7475 family protein n=1 Tax=Haladaptatus sp. W1 TaxID=1897478 RepID=UPI000849CDD7|nr:hypothetical protein [Haladaptatus sp. W1]ODR80224.1 hypothetical protein BG842_21745 [Haladaptatus sp. W1]